MGMEEVIGPDRLLSLQFPGSLQVLADHAGTSDQPPDLLIEHLCQLQSSLEKTYGQIPGRGLAVRSGRAGFKHILREFADELGLVRLEFRLMPGTCRLEAGSNALAKLFNQFTCQHVVPNQDDQDILWLMDHLTSGAHGQTESSACQFAVGLLQEAMYWLSGGKTFQVEEIQCASTGHAQCKVRIRKKPIQ